MIGDVLPPFGFSRIQAQNLTGWEGTVPHTVFNRLVDDVTKLLGVPPDTMEEEREVSYTQKLSFLPDDMISIPKGKFLYGDDKREKEINYDYYIDVYPVTNRYYKEFIDETDHRIPYIDTKWAEHYDWDQFEKNYPEGKDDHPNSQDQRYRISLCQ